MKFYPSSPCFSKLNFWPIVILLLCITSSITPAFPATIDALHYQSNMFGKLDIEVVKSDLTVSFESHELVYVAQRLMEEYTSPGFEDVPVYTDYDEHIEEVFALFSSELLSRAEQAKNLKTGQLNRLMGTLYQDGMKHVLGVPEFRDTLGKIKQPAEPLMEEEYDEFILPPLLKPNSTALNWLSLATYLRTHKEPIKGWWVCVGNRFILLRNLPGEREHFYVSDHGLQNDVLRDTKEDLLTFTDQGRSECNYSFSFWNFYKKLSESEKDTFRAHFVLMFIDDLGRSHARNEFLLYVCSLPSDLKPLAMHSGITHGIFNSIGSRKEGEEKVLSLNAAQATRLKVLDPLVLASAEDMFRVAIERIRYRGGVQVPIYVKSLYEGELGGLSPFFTQVDRIFHTDDARRYRIFFILKELSKKIGQGLQEFLFRPLHSFGSAEKGESYKVFSEVVDMHTAFTEQKLAEMMRGVLQGKSVEDEKLFFIPNLVASWFLAETVRNPSSFLCGLIMLDLMEGGISHMDGDEKNLYSLRHALVHPLKPKDSRKDVKIRDLYGDEVALANFDGTHPMAHSGSVPNSKTKLSNGTKLNAVRQKEGHLLIHWLSKMILCSDYRLTPSPASLEKVLCYDDIKLLYNTTNPSRKIKNDEKLLCKWELLQTIKGHMRNRISKLEKM